MSSVARFLFIPGVVRPIFKHDPYAPLPQIWNRTITMMSPSSLTLVQAAIDSVTTASTPTEYQSITTPVITRMVRVFSYLPWVPLGHVLLQ